ncbi:hypothetical protein [Aquimarina aquimarini]|uniref:hypothetical protein n=1 Tax=Aquimarina aquimarini TaxID=1191734 RepID=UPI000D54E695|nr:hypothetical protein [Aquimarina aquimarini]
MNYNLIAVLQQLSTTFFKEIEGNFTIQELWEWMLFDQENSLLNDTLQIHQASGVPTKGRNIELDKNTSIAGDYYCFTYIDHQPSYHLQKVKSPDDLANLLLSKSGITNMFTTVITPIVKGKILQITKKENLTQMESELINEIQQLINCFDDSNFDKLAKKGHSCLVKYKKFGLSQQDTYDTVHFIAKVYQTLDLEAKSDLVHEFLDYISGYIGDKKRWIWSNQLL